MTVRYAVTFACDDRSLITHTGTMEADQALALVAMLIETTEPDPIIDNPEPAPAVREDADRPVVHRRA